MNQITAIYVRRSVSDRDKGNNSLSIDTQKEACIRYVGSSDYRIYCDDGKSGKDVAHRPAFMQMMTDAKNGLIDKIIVKKYDRFSRNMREYLNVTNELDKYGVGVISLSEPFNTSM
ncbi:MAG: recombinase family protein [Candidatus Ornithomonoglobus sp.]